LGLTASAFRRGYDGRAMLERLRHHLIAPYYHLIAPY
jgi:hypothetical protein